MKNAENIFYGVQAGNAEYVDSTFPREKMIRDPDHPHTHQGNLANKAATATWVDSIDIVYKESDGHSLFGSTGIQPEDIE